MRVYGNTIDYSWNIAAGCSLQACNVLFINLKTCVVVVVVQCIVYNVSACLLKVRFKVFTVLKSSEVPNYEHK